MKNLIIRRIVILMTASTIFTSLLMTALGLYIVETPITNVKSLPIIICALIGIIFFIVVISYIVLRKIVKPVRNIVSVALSIVDGDFSIRADESIQGEIGFIGKTMNKLSIELYQNLSQLYIEKNRLSQVLNSLQEGMIAVDQEMNITHYNNILTKMFSLDDSSIIGSSIHHMYFLDEVIVDLDRVLNYSESVMKQWTYHKLILKIIMEPIHNEKGKVVGAVIIFSDITEVEKLESIRKNYVANVSHELRSPLTSIRALIEPLMDSIVTDKADVKRYYQIIYKESLRLSRLVDDIMELSRLQTSDTSILKSNIQLNPILDMVYERYRLFDETKTLIYDQKPLPIVKSNYDRIEQILVILIDNAFKFTAPGGTIELFTEEKEDYLVVSVKDNGIGIDTADIPYIFNRFYKSDTSRTQKGTGLGLSIAKEILQIMDETIEVISEPHRGSTFFFTIHKA